MSEQSIEDLPYRPCVGIMLVNAAGAVWHGERIDTPGAWQMPQGGVETGEDLLEAAYRELEEETSVTRDDVELIGQVSDFLYYDLPPELLNTVWNGRFRGQKQFWYLMRLKSGDKAIDIETENAEFAQWRWGDIQDLPGMIVPFKRHIYEALTAEFSPLI